MNMFKEIKDAVSVRDAASFYGYTVGRGGMMCCPFHDDKHPSMKVDTRFHCFGCGADGDVINFVQMLFGLDAKQAALKLAGDFRIPVDIWKPPDVIKVKKTRERRQSLNERFQKNKIRFWKTITDYYQLLLRWREQYASASPDEEWDERFILAVQNIDLLEYVMDCFIEGDLETQVDIINEYGRNIKEYERRINGTAD